jgi:putative intracellular protease/amidase
LARAIVFLQEGMADWEAGPVTAVLRRFLNVEIQTATPGGDCVTSVGGLQIDPDLAFEEVEVEDFDIFLLIGSDAWVDHLDQGFCDLLCEALNEGKVVGAICAGTVMVARAGLLEHRAHTSNGRDWLAKAAPGYKGAENYVDSPKAVVDGKLVTAPGSAPGTFAAAVARLAAPDQEQVIAGYETMSRQEWAV